MDGGRERQGWYRSPAAERGAPWGEVELRVATGRRLDEGRVPDRVSGWWEAEERELFRRRGFGKRVPLERVGARLHRVVTDPVLAGALEAHVEQEAGAAGIGEVDPAMEHVRPVREQRSANARRRALGSVELRITIGHDQRLGR